MLHRQETFEYSEESRQTKVNRSKRSLKLALVLSAFSLGSIQARTARTTRLQPWFREVTCDPLYPFDIPQKDERHATR